ncbi:phosphoethanolamine transferase [Rhodoferax koreense]|uniref:Phosphoethanolamine transferase n=1 Tax=Rhodoferax koreensis TaxID=1842727 RepID=A0A1P8JXU5_9BURK|nr:phosphoethanolamine--lipid A transferase [Rhodoferax koreense]APW38576.1 phosphoethanolamine transferase [Rhodoferax koreense]
MSRPQPPSFSAVAPSSTSPAQRPERQRQSLWLMLAASLWIATVCNLPLWRELLKLPELQTVRGLWFGLCFAVMIAGATTALLSLFAWRWTLKPAITLFLVSAAAGGYFMMAYGIVIDPTMMVNALQTDARETRDLLNWQFAAAIVVLGILPAWWAWRQPVRRTPVLRQLLRNLLSFALGLAVLIGALFAVFQDMSSLMRNHTQLRYLINPLNSFYALGKVAAKPFERDNTRILPLGQDARIADATDTASKPPLLLLVLGETGRSGNFALNGYARPTTPGLSALAARPDERLTSFRNAWSCGTNTAASVPCMFSHLGRTAFEDRKANYEGLMDVLSRSGMAVLWIDNQSGCKGACDRIPNVSTTQLQDPALCSEGECFDDIMLKDLDGRIKALPAERRAKGVVVVLHQMGSHGPAYYKRTPTAFKKFMPECTSNALQECSPAQLVNAYDNTIFYTDHFLSSAVDWLKTQETASAPAMMYVADHGESLGENNIYLHGMPYNIAPDVQKHVPWITWLSPAFEARSRISTGCLQKRADERISHDNYFHSVLGMLGVQTAVYQPALDLFAPCTDRQAAATKSP